MSTYKYKYLKYKSKYINLYNQKLVGGSTHEYGFNENLNTNTKLNTNTNACNTIINLFILSRQILNLLFNKLDKIDNTNLINIQTFEDIKTDGDLNTLLWSIIYLLHNTNLRPTNNTTKFIQFIAMKIKNLLDISEDESYYKKYGILRSSSVNVVRELDTTDLDKGLHIVFDIFFPNEYLFVDDYLSKIKDTKLKEFNDQIEQLNKLNRAIYGDDKNNVIKIYTDLSAICNKITEDRNMLLEKHNDAIEDNTNIETEKQTQIDYFNKNIEQMNTDVCKSLTDPSLTTDMDVYNNNIIEQLNTLKKLKDVCENVYNKKLSDIFLYTKLLNYITFKYTPLILIINPYTLSDLTEYITINIKNINYELSSCIIDIIDKNDQSKTIIRNSIGFINQDNEYFIYDSNLNRIFNVDWKINFNIYNKELNKTTRDKEYIKIVNRQKGIPNVIKTNYAKIRYLIYVKQSN
jgi:hypothetical protein